MKFFRKKDAVTGSQSPAQTSGLRLGSASIHPFPFFADLRRYHAAALRADGRSALAVMLLALPQALAFATIAGVPLVYGVMSSAVAAMVSPLFASSRFTVVGPSNATSLMLFSFLAMNPAIAARHGEIIPLLVLMVGLITISGAMARLADLLQYVSRSVLVGYISGAAVLIITGQLVHALGVATPVAQYSPSSFVTQAISIVRSLPEMNWVSPIIAGCTIAMYFFIQKWRPRWPAFALALLFSSILFGGLIRMGIGPFAVEPTFHGYKPSDLIPRMPSLFRKGVFEDIAALIGVALAIAFLASLENSLMAKSLASRTGDRINVNQDMFSVGMANIASAFGGGMPASGSLTRSALNFESGAATRFSSLMAGVFTLSAAVLIAWLGVWGIPLIDFIPRSALAALIIGVAISLFNKRHIRICLKSTRDDQRVLIISFIATLLAPLDVAIFIGVAVSLAFFLRRASRPSLVEYEFSDDGELREKSLMDARPIPSISIVHVEGDLFFGAADMFRSQIEHAVEDPNLKIVILRMKNARHLDATSAMAFEDFIHNSRKRGVYVLVSGVSKQLYKVFKNSGILETIQKGADRKEGESNLFLQFPSNPNLSTRDALRRAQQLLGDKKADIRIFHNPKPESPNS